MLLLSGASDIIRVVTDAVADIECYAAWADNTSGVITVGRSNPASITSATTTTIVAAPGASVQRSIRHLNIRNEHGSTACTVRVEFFDGSTATVLKDLVLQAAEALVLGENGIWVYYDPLGKPYMGNGPFATQEEMEAGTSLTTIVTPGRQQYHPSAAKFWVDTRPGAANDASYNVASVLDTAAGITVITIATDFSSTAWCPQATCESTSDTMTVTNLKFTRIGLGDVAAGTVAVEVHDGTAITAVLEDPTSWFVCGFGDQ